MTTAPHVYSASRGEDDPYRYQVGFGNSFASEAIPGTLPLGQNGPQKNKYELYAEVVNGTPFTVPREFNERTWLYRIRPSVAHRGFNKLENQNPNLHARFSLSNSTQGVSATQLSWRPHPLPSPNEKVTFVEGLKTIMGNGSPMLREGLAIHVYSCNTSMEKTAFVNSDGDFLLVPVVGRLDIQTELGKLMVRPGEIAVVQRGLKYKVSLPDGAATGYIQEIFGAHYELPELGPLGANGLANVRDFEHPMASFDLDQSPWEVIYKLGGQLFVCQQDHTPFDVVAWHGNYIPYKYDTDAFIAVGSISKDHTDPSIFTVLTAPSKTPGVALADFAIFKRRWDVAEQTFRPPYFHRNTCTEVIGMVKGMSTGRSDGFVAGALVFETGFCPHGVPAPVYNLGTEKELKPEVISDGTLAVLFESGMMMTVTDYAMNTDLRQDHNPELWLSLDPKALKHIEEMQADLAAAGLTPLQL